MIATAKADEKKSGRAQIFGFGKRFGHAVKGHGKICDFIMADNLNPRIEFSLGEVLGRLAHLAQGCQEMLGNEVDSNHNGQHYP